MTGTLPSDGLPEYTNPPRPSKVLIAVVAGFAMVFAFSMGAYVTGIFQSKLQPALQIEVVPENRTDG